MMTQAAASHAPGKCPDQLYGKNCNGIARHRPDPYAVEMGDDYTLTWLCDGEAHGIAQDV